MPRELTSDEVVDFRRRACETALRQFARSGRNGVTMRSITDELGCSRMTPYRYFEDKEEIFAAARAAAFRDFADYLAPALNDSTQPLSRLESLGRAYFRFAKEQPDKYRLIFDFAEDGAQEHPELLAELEAHWSRTDAVMQSVIDAGRLRGDPTVLNHLFWAAMHGAVSLHLAGKIAPSCDFEVLCREIVRVVYRGLLAEPETR